ncbi:hypothetical protein PTSG_05958 [Salpingoeca rosetta]|uniref:Uncharacterized protein n=1 Tax=Salpingoeca rosetta (strain ATCC 50818 / BSB-021) TaxID=946362 RepID=F2UD98_SALR5|nr:uncharacterized protein PTSG_05958 [Salpingoeca rosetta]EGD74593.1 hypothetical protein PTSG_05958 [Salpingoeca rosetta]|eukprot:XP_004992850.1 hypothetical protein PTSG_05958 [Salpingoeca rosetta]
MIASCSRAEPNNSCGTTYMRLKDCAIQIMQMTSPGVHDVISSTPLRKLHAASGHLNVPNLPSN